MAAIALAPAPPAVALGGHGEQVQVQVHDQAHAGAHQVDRPGANQGGASLGQAGSGSCHETAGRHDGAHAGGPAGTGDNGAGEPPEGARSATACSSHCLAMAGVASSSPWWPVPGQGALVVGEMPSPPDNRPLDVGLRPPIA